MTPPGSGPPFCPETVSNVPYVIRFLRARSDPPGLEPGSDERMRDLALPLNYRSMCPVSGAVTIYVKWVYLRGMASPDWSGPDSDRY